MTAIVHVQRWVSHTLQSGGEPMIAECRCSGASGRAPTAADRCPRHFAAGWIHLLQTVARLLRYNSSVRTDVHAPLREHRARSRTTVSAA